MRGSSQSGRGSASGARGGIGRSRGWEDYDGDCVVTQFESRQLLVLCYAREA